MDTIDLVFATQSIVTAFVSHNTTNAEELTEIITDVATALRQIDQPPAIIAPKVQEPAVPIKKSVTPDHIICLEDGKRLKMLKLHLMTEYGLTPDAYRAKWNLPADYPMVAPNYSDTRKSLAIKMGLGRKKPVAPVKSARKRAA